MVIAAAATVLVVVAVVFVVIIAITLHLACFEAEQFAKNAGKQKRLQQQQHRKCQDAGSNCYCLLLPVAWNCVAVACTPQKMRSANAGAFPRLLWFLWVRGWATSETRSDACNVRHTRSKKYLCVDFVAATRPIDCYNGILFREFHFRIEF